MGIDDFHDPELKRKDKDRLLKQVLQPLRENKKAKYQRYDWGTKQLEEWHEGEYDLKIGVDMPQDQAAKRGIVLTPKVLLIA